VAARFQPGFFLLQGFHSLLGHGSEIVGTHRAIADARHAGDFGAGLQVGRRGVAPGRGGAALQQQERGQHRQQPRQQRRLVH